MCYNVEGWGTETIICIWISWRFWVGNMLEERHMRGQEEITEVVTTSWYKKGIKRQLHNGQGDSSSPRDRNGKSSRGQETEACVKQCVWRKRHRKVMPKREFTHHLQTTVRPDISAEHPDWLVISRLEIGPRHMWGQSQWMCRGGMMERQTVEGGDRQESCEVGHEADCRGNSKIKSGRQTWALLAEGNGMGVVCQEEQHEDCTIS